MHTPKNWLLARFNARLNGSPKPVLAYLKASAARPARSVELSRPVPKPLHVLHTSAGPLFGGPVELSRPALHRVIEATEANIHVKRPNLPGEDQALFVARTLKNSPVARGVARAAALKLAKVGVGAGAGAGAYLTHRLGGRAKAVKRGAVGGAIAGALFSVPETSLNITRAICFAAKARLTSHL